MYRYVLPAVLALTLSTGTLAELYEVDIQVLASSGVASPDGNGVLSDQMSAPYLNNNGQVAFLSNVLATSNPDPIDDFGFYRADTNSLEVLVRGGDPSAAGNMLNLSFLLTPLLLKTNIAGFDRLGRVAFLGIDSENMDAVYRADGVSLQTILQDEESAPFGDIRSLGPAALGFVVNDEGQMSYQVQTDDDSLMIRSDETDHQVLFRLGQDLPGGGQLAAFRSFAMNNQGTVAARLNTSSDTFGQFVTDGTVTTKIMQSGEAAVDGMGSYTIGLTRAPDINNAGAVPLMLAVDDITTDYFGLFQFDGMGLLELTRTGNPTFGGTLLGLLGAPVINDQGSILYGVLSSDNNNVTRLILRRDAGEIELISDAQLIPAPLSIITTDVTGAVINNQDQALILARGLFNGAPPRVNVLLFFDPEFGYARIAQEQQPFRGGTIISLDAAVPFSILESTSNYKNAQNGINDQGQVAYRYTLDTGESGIALAQVTFLPDELILWDGFEL